MALGGILAASPGAAQPAQAEAAARTATAKPVLLISVDGLAPATLFEGEKTGPAIPVMRRFLKEGAFAQRVINVNPTVTSPNHTTLITGVSPREHGIYNNRPFVAAARLPGGFRHYADIKVPTLWGAAKAAGYRTGSIFWPVTDGAQDIDFNLLEGSSTDDHQITRDAISLIEREKPELLTVHFVTYDSQQHQHGPGTAQGYAALERIDSAIGEIIAAQRKAYPDGVIAIVSDHGFYTVTHQVNLNTAFVDAGLVTLDGGAEPAVASWRAFAWYVGGMAMVVLKDPQDEELRQEVHSFLQRLAANPEAGIERIYTADELEGRGLSPQARFVIALKAGYRMGNAMTGPLSTPFKGGAHGAFSTGTIRPEMHSAFLIAGPGIAAGRNLGTIDMRQIAPTLANALGIPFPSTTKIALPLAD
jgi:predicted AlkP superfamily pyrophosphatase or phosphodiesterase